MYQSIVLTRWSGKFAETLCDLSEWYARFLGCTKFILEKAIRALSV